MFATTAASGSTEVPANSNRRRGWVIASEDEQSAPVVRPTNFDARRSANAWNKGKGPSPASIPSRASSLTPAPASGSVPQLAPYQPLPVLSLQPEPALTQQVQSIPQPIQQQLPPQSLPKRQINSSMASPDLDADPNLVASNGKRRPSPPLLVPPKHTYRKSPSVKVLPPSAYSDHKRMMAGVGLANRSPKPSSPSAARTTFASATASTSASPPKAGPRFPRRAQQASASSDASTSSAGFSKAQVASSGPVPSTASSVAAEPATLSLKGKERALDSPDLSASDKNENESASTTASKDDDTSPTYRRNHPSMLQGVTPLTPVSERSWQTDRESIASSASENCTPSPSGQALRKKPSDLRIELPPQSSDLNKSGRPAIMIDSSHVNDHAATVAVPPRKRRSTGSAQGTDNGDEGTIYDDDNSSWPSTPSTTPLDYYFSDAAVLKATAKHSHQQTTMQIVSPDPTALSMGSPMVVVTSPSTASEVSSERRSSASSSCPSDNSTQSQPTIVPAPALPKVVEELPTEAITPRATGKSLSFDLPDASGRDQPVTTDAATALKSTSKTHNFFSKMGPSKSSNRASGEVVAPTPTPLNNRDSVDLKRQSGEQRRSVDLKPILLHTAAKPKVSEPRTKNVGVSSDATSSVPSRTEQQQQRRMSGGRVPVRSNVVPYHSRRDSEASATSSSASVGPPKRTSLERGVIDPRFSPLSNISTAITVPSPVIDTKQPARVEPVVIASASHNRFAASMPSLHQTPAEETQLSDSTDPPSQSAIRQLIDSQKGRTTKDNDSIAEWISVSHNDVPAPDHMLPYGNGGAGELSNQRKEPAKRLSQGKPWKLNRFAVSEAALSTTPAVNQRLPSGNAASQPKHVRVRSASRSSTQSLSASPNPSRVNNLGFTGNRNAVLQSLYARRSVLALAAGSVSVASMGRNSVPSAMEVAQLKAHVKKQSKAEKKLKKKSGKSSAPALPLSLPQPLATMPLEASQMQEEVRVAVSQKRHSLYDIQHGMGTVKSMMPELGNWTNPTDSTESPPPASKTFRDYEDDESDLFDSDSDSEDDDRWDGVDEEAEVPVRLGERSKEPEMLNVFFSSLRTSKAPERDGPGTGQINEGRTGSAADATVIRSPSLANVAPGSVEHKGKEIRLCVEEARQSTTNAPGADTTAIWKAVKVVDLDKSTCNDGGYLELKRQRLARQTRTKAMKLESEVSRGAFASFVGNNSPVRQAKRSSTDLTRASPKFGGREFGSPTKPSASKASDLPDDELFITKEDKDSYIVRRMALASTDTEELLEVVRRSSTGSWLAPNHLLHDLPLRYSVNDQDPRQRRYLPGTPVFDFDKAFPSPFLGSESSAESRPSRRQESSATTESTNTTDEGQARRVMIRVLRDDTDGFEASFISLDGNTWVWKARALASQLESTVETDSSLANGLTGLDLHLYTVVDANTVELASYTTESQLRNALGLFQPRGKRAHKPLPEDGGSLETAPPAVVTQVTPLGTSAFGMSQLRVDAAPRRGIRGGPLLRHQSSAISGVGAPGSAAWKQRQWQNQRAAVSTDSVVQVHNNAVTNAQSSLIVDVPTRKWSMDAAPTPTQPAASSSSKRKGELRFEPDCPDRDLAVVSLLALLGMVKA